MWHKNRTFQALVTHCKSSIENVYFENCALLQNIGYSYEAPFKQELELAYLLQGYKKKKEHIQSSIQFISHMQYKVISILDLEAFLIIFCNLGDVSSSVE